jgi:hypothetical protein
MYNSVLITGHQPTGRGQLMGRLGSVGRMTPAGPAYSRLLYLFFGVDFFWGGPCSFLQYLWGGCFSELCFAVGAMRTQDGCTLAAAVVYEWRECVCGDVGGGGKQQVYISLRIAAPN